MLTAAPTAVKVQLKVGCDALLWPPAVRTRKVSRPQFAGRLLRYKHLG
jgi:hypothetical protein